VRNLMRTLVNAMMLLVLLLVSVGGYAHDHSTGVHGMVLMQVEQRIFASHMPLHNSKHAFQVVMELQLENQKHATLKSLKALLAKHALVTLMPEVFSLSKLQNGQLKSFKGTVFANHFERKGEVAMENVTFTVKQLLLNQPLTAIEGGDFYVLKIAEQYSLLVHRIAKPPCYDQILLASHPKGYSVVIDNMPPMAMSPGVIRFESGLNFSNGLMVEKQLYLETQDFLK
jgi:hypothetical protein